MTKPHKWKRVPASDYRYVCEECGELFGTSEPLDEYTVREISSTCPQYSKPVMDWRPALWSVVIGLVLWVAVILTCVKACGKPLDYKPWFTVTSCPTYDAVREVMMVDRLTGYEDD